MNIKQSKGRFVQIESLAIAIAIILAMALHEHQSHPRIGEVILFLGLISGLILAGIILLEDTFGGYTISMATRKHLNKIPAALAIVGFMGYFAWNHAPPSVFIRRIFLYFYFPWKYRTFAFFVYFFVDCLKSFKNPSSRSLQNKHRRICTGETSASEIEKFIIGNTIDRKRMGRLYIIRVNDQSGNSTNLPFRSEKHMTLFESTDNFTSPLSDIYSAIKEYIAPSICNWENMNLRARMTGIKRAFYHTLDLTLKRCMESTSDLGYTMSPSVDCLKMELSARSRTIKSKLRSFLKHEGMDSIIIQWIKNNPGFMGRDLDSFRKWVEWSEHIFDFLWILNIKHDSNLLVMRPIWFACGNCRIFGEDMTLTTAKEMRKIIKRNQRNFQTNLKPKIEELLTIFSKKKEMEMNLTVYVANSSMAEEPEWSKVIEVLRSLGYKCREKDRQWFMSIESE